MIVSQSETADKLQSVLFKRQYYTVQTARNWLKKHNLKYYKVDVTKNYLRFRQYNPQVLDIFRTYNITPSIKGIFKVN